MPIFMKYAAVKGDATSDGHKDWIVLHSFQWGVGRGIASSQGSQLNRQASGASVSEITITKQLDNSSPGLLQDLFKGILKNDVQIDWTEVTDNSVYFSVATNNTGIAGYSFSSGGDRPSESLSLNFTKIAITNTATDPQGAKTPTTVTYDVGLEKLV
jgi:type VI secretion system secreted protein Hcp